MHKRRFVEADCRVSLDHRSQLFEGSLLTRGQQDRPGGGETTTAVLHHPGHVPETAGQRSARLTAIRVATCLMKKRQ